MLLVCAAEYFHDDKLDKTHSKAFVADTSLSLYPGWLFICSFLFAPFSYIENKHKKTF